MNDIIPSSGVGGGGGGGMGGFAGFHNFHFRDPEEIFRLAIPVINVLIILFCYPDSRWTLVQFQKKTGRAEQKNLPWGSMDIFWNCTMLNCVFFTNSQIKKSRIMQKH